MDRRAWWTAVHGVAKSQTLLSAHTKHHKMDIYIYISDEPLLMPTYILNILILFLFFSEYLKSF